MSTPHGGGGGSVSAPVSQVARAAETEDGVENASVYPSSRCFERHGVASHQVRGANEKRTIASYSKGWCQKERVDGSQWTWWDVRLPGRSPGSISQVSRRPRTYARAQKLFSAEHAVLEEVTQGHRYKLQRKTIVRNTSCRGGGVRHLPKGVLRHSVRGDGRPL